MRDATHPYYNRAPVAGRMTTFAMLEYPSEEPPREIVIGDDRWVLQAQRPRDTMADDEGRDE